VGDGQERGAKVRSEEYRVRKEGGLAVSASFATHFFEGMAF
jgi:hypothetical protein